MAGTYPPAQAAQEAVVADRQLFMRTLRTLHDRLGTQFRIPTVSGKELDLHLLYKQARTCILVPACARHPRHVKTPGPQAVPPRWVDMQKRCSTAAVLLRWQQCDTAGLAASGHVPV